MKNILIFSLMISTICVHAMETEFNPVRDTENAPEILPQLQKKITKLRVTAQTLQQRVRGLPNHANFDLLSVVDNKMNDHTKAVLLANAEANLRSSLERRTLCLEATMDCLEYAHEQTMLSQAIENMQEILAQNAPEKIKSASSSKKSD